MLLEYSSSTWFAILLTFCSPPRVSKYTCICMYYVHLSCILGQAGLYKASAATEWREPTLHINNHVSSLYSPSTISMEWPLRLCRGQRLAAAIHQILRYKPLFWPLCRWQPPSQSRAPRLSAGLDQAPCFRPFPAEELLCFSLSSLRLVAAAGVSQE